MEIFCFSHHRGWSKALKWESYSKIWESSWWLMVLMCQRCTTRTQQYYWWHFSKFCAYNECLLNTCSTYSRFEAWIQIISLCKKPVLKRTELLFYMQFTPSLQTASTSDCFNSIVSFSWAAALSVRCCINDAISLAEILCTASSACV